MVEKLLNQEQIDAMVRAARGQESAPKLRGKNVVRWDARQAGQIGREQMRALSAQHENFARNLTHSLGAYLRVGFSTALVSAEHLTYGEFLQRIPEMTYLGSVRLLPLQETAILQLDLPIVFSFIDVLLGGEGKSAYPPREITEIEEQILDTVVRIICRELQNVWQALSLEFQFAQQEQPSQVARLMPTEDKTLSLSFEINMAEKRGTMNLMVPAVVSNALLRKLSAGWAQKPKARTEIDGKMRTRLLDCPFELDLGLKNLSVPLSELMQLVPGGVLAFTRRVEAPATLCGGGHDLFTADVARQGAQRAARLREPVAGQESEGKPAR